MWELTGNFPRLAATLELLWNVPVWIPVFSPHMKYKPIKRYSFLIVKCSKAVNLKAPNLKYNSSFT